MSAILFKTQYIKSRNIKVIQGNQSIIFPSDSIYIYVCVCVNTNINNG